MPATSKIDFLTAATVSYFPQALATLRSARQHGPEGSHYFFAIDATPSAVATLRDLTKSEERLEIFGPHDLETGRDAFLRAFSYFSPIEMCCLAKYVGMAYVLSLPAAADYCIFADADVMFFGSLRESVAELGNAAFLLTPHQFGPSTDVAEHEYLQSGWINAGFFAVRRNGADTGEILGWLVDRITRRGFFAPTLGLYCDQSWLSLAPLAFSGRVTIATNPGMNVAYWNLTERELSFRDGHYFANGRSLLFFHFSGFDGLQCNRLSKHADLVVKPATALAGICAEYKKALAAAAPLQPALANLDTHPCSREDLQERIEAGSRINRTDIGSPGATRGIFARLGGRIDTVLRRVAGR